MEVELEESHFKMMEYVNMICGVFFGLEYYK